MFYSSDRGQTEPIAALLAVVVIAAGLALYAGVLDEALDLAPDRDLAPATLERVEAHLTPDGIAYPARLLTVHEVTPKGYETNVTLSADDWQRSVGPRPPSAAMRASRTVSVRVGPTTVRKGTLRVVIW